MPALHGITHGTLKPAEWESPSQTSLSEHVVVFVVTGTKGRGGSRG